MKTKDLFQYRSVWMGVAIIFIVFFHSEMTFDNIIVETIREFGYGGVDIFLFASGIGCYYSLQKDSDIARFMKRRFLRIMPVYLVFMVIWLAYQRLLFEMPISSMLGNLFCVQNFTLKGNEFNWYVSAMWLMYLLAPFFASLASKLKTWRACLAVMAILLLFTVSFWYSYTFIISIARIPIFFLGVFVAKKALDGFTIHRAQGIALTIVSVLGILLLLLLSRQSPDRLWLMGGLWYPFLLIVPGLCYLLSLLSSRLEASKAGRLVVRCFTAIGKCSFEIYLVHIFVFDIFQNILVTRGICPDNNGWRLFLLLPIAMGTVLLHLIGRVLQHGLKRLSVY